MASLSQGLRVPKSPTLTQGNVQYLERVDQYCSQNVYPALLLLQQLTHGGFNDEHKPRQASNTAEQEACRDFLDSFSYLCDIEKGGPTVTAAAIQQRAKGTRLWLAANDGIKDKVKVYADAVLEKTKRYALDKDNRQEIAEEIFQLAVENCKARLKFYQKEVRRYADECLKSVKQDGGPGKDLQQSLQQLLVAQNSADLVLKCFNLRGDAVDAIKTRSASTGDHFAELAHFVGRMSATRQAALVVAGSIVKAPALSKISSIKVVEKPEERQLTVSSQSPYELVREVCGNSTNPLDGIAGMHGFVDLDMRINKDARSKLVISDRSIKTKLHCELQLQGLFSRSPDWKFLYDDKYIGCSKPACYFCYNWISNHKDCYVHPRTHNKVITACRGPDDLGGTELRETYRKLRLKIDQDILVTLMRSHEERRTFRYQHQSTDGSSSRAPSQFSARTLLEGAV